MPTDLRVQAAHAYIAQPVIQTGYNANSGGLGTVSAIVIEHPMLIAHAISSTVNLRGCDCQSALIQENDVFSRCDIQLIIVAFNNFEDFPLFVENPVNEFEQVCPLDRFIFLLQ